MIRQWIATPSRRTRRVRSQWRDRRPARFLDRVEALAQLVPPGAVTADLGCGAGLHLPYLGRPGGRARRRRRRWSTSPARRRPTPGPCRPTSSTCRSGAARSRGRGHARATSTSRACGCRGRSMELHHATAVGAPAHLTMLRGRRRGTVPRRRLPGPVLRAVAPDALARRAGRRRLRGRSRSRSIADDDSWLHALVRRRAEPARHRRRRHAPARVRAEPERSTPPTPASASPAPATGSGPPRSPPGIVTRDRDPRHALRAPRRRHDRPGRSARPPRADELTRDEYRAGRARVERLVALAAAGRGVLRRARRLPGRGRPARAQPGMQPDAVRRRARLRDAEHERAQRRTRSTCSRRTSAPPPPSRTTQCGSVPLSGTRAAMISR